MIIVKAGHIKIKDIVKITPILFCFGNGAYFYVESGIVENELRTLKNWKTLGPDQGDLWFITYQQGVSIPIELGDYLVEKENE